MDVLRNLLLIHPTKCAGTSISKKILELKGYSKNKSNRYSGYLFNLFFQKHIHYFHTIINSKGLLLVPIILIFYFVCLYFKIQFQTFCICGSLSNCVRFVNCFHIFCFRIAIKYNESTNSGLPSPCFIAGNYFKN